MSRMLRLWTCIFILLALCCCGCGRKETPKPAAAYTVTDDRGTVTGFEKAPEKVMTLSMGLDGIALGLVKPEQLVSVNELLQDPKSSNIVELAQRVPAKHTNPSAEHIYALKPDVLFVDRWARADMVATIREMGIKVIVVKYPHNVEDIKDNVRLVAKALHKEAQGEAVVREMERELQQLHAALDELPQGPRTRVALLSVMSNYGGKGSLWDGICREARVINCISDVGLEQGQSYTKELFVKSSPDVMLLPAYDNNGKFANEEYKDYYLKDPALAVLPAIRTQRLYFPRDSYIYNWSQDVVFGVRELAYCVYGKKFAQPSNRHICVY